MNRRSFLKTGSMAGATVAWGRLPWPDLRAAEMAAAPPPSPSSVDKPMRWAQLTPVENDPGKFDLHFWLDCASCSGKDAPVWSE